MRTNPIITFPDTSNPAFSAILYSKKEFNKNKYNNQINTNNQSYEDISSEMCKKTDFNLTNNQIFVKNFISPNTPYNSILLYHGVGVGKTCAAISIAEQFLPIYEKKCLVLMPTNLKDNFKKQLFDINNLNQCTSKKYLSYIQNNKILNKETIEKKVNKIINEKYEFLGFLEFANQIKNNKEKYKSVEKFAGFIKKHFSNRVIIIDEVHNLRSDTEDTQKISPLMLMEVLKYSENVKLIMLTATPMFNGSPEIIWIINYILANEKRPLIEHDNVFDNDGALTTSGLKLIEKSTTGYVSYMRGENPFTFPFRLYPYESGDKSYLRKSNIPLIDIYNSKLEKNMVISDKFSKQLNISTMSGYQTSVYESFEKKVKIDDKNDEEYDGVENEQINSISYNISTMIQVSNIVYPEGAEEKQKYGRSGFNNNFYSTGTNGWKYQVSYKDKYKKAEDNFLNEDNLPEYSAKLDSIISYILKSDGIVYVYSNYIYSSLLPLAIALEHRGFKRSNDSTIIKTPNVSPSDKEKYGKMRYSFLTKDNNIRTSIPSEVDRITSPDNLNGEQIKVILGTSVTTEGINFKRIREIHIVEPWFHLNKLEQVIGRAVRMCSHIDLPASKRNVTIFKHACVPNFSKAKSEKKECTDLRIYRIAENKQTNIQKVEKLLIQNSVDCNLNYPVLVYNTNKKVDIKTSQRVKIIGYKVLDRQDDKHRDLKCRNQIDNSKDRKLSDVTYSKAFLTDDISRYIDVLKNVFENKNNKIQTYKNILENSKQFIFSLDEEVLKFSIDAILENKIIFNIDGESGYIVYFSDTYMFQPLKNNNIINNNNINLKQNVIRLSNNSEFVVPTSGVLQKLLEDVSLLSNNKTDFIKEYLLYDYCIDRLSYTEFNSLMTEILTLSADEQESPHVVYIKKSLIEMGILVLVKKEKDVYYVLNVFLSKIDDLYILDFTKKTYSKVSSLRFINFLETPEYLKRIGNIKDGIDSIDFIGYMEYNKSNIIQFKIVGESKLKTAGTVCGTGKMKQDDYKNIISSFDNSFDIKSIGKISNKKLCTVMELTLRTSQVKFKRVYDTLLMKNENKKKDGKK